MKEIDICKSLDLILQKGFCTRTVERARSELLKIKNQWYIEMNEGGTPHSEEEINKVKIMLKEMSYDENK